MAVFELKEKWSISWDFSSMQWDIPLALDPNLHPSLYIHTTSHHCHSYSKHKHFKLFNMGSSPFLVTAFTALILSSLLVCSLPSASGCFAGEERCIRTGGCCAVGRVCCRNGRCCPRASPVCLGNGRCGRVGTRKLFYFKYLLVHNKFKYQKNNKTCTYYVCSIISQHVPCIYIYSLTLTVMYFTEHEQQGCWRRGGHVPNISNKNLNKGRATIISFLNELVRWKTKSLKLAQYLPHTVVFK